jgi:DNA repair exonuclease SbcCD ATPase subunit
MQVRLYNVGGINRELYLSIKKGISIYEAPNAYGKTSLARALISLLTSEITAEDLLNVFSDEGYVEAEIDGKLYYRRFKRIKNRIEEEKKLYVDDKNALLLSYFSPENPLVARILVGDENIEWFISAASKIDEIKKKKENLQYKLGEIKATYDEYQKKYNEAENYMKQLEAINQQLEKLEKDRESIRINTENSIRITKKNRLEDLEKRLEVRQKELREKEAKAKRIEREIEELKKNLNSISKENLLKEIEELNAKLQNLNSKKYNLDVDYRMLGRVLDEIKEADERHLAVCYVCGHEVNPSIWKERLDTIKKELTEVTRQRDEITKEINNIQSRINTITNKVKEIEKYEQQLTNKQNELETYKLEISEIQKSIETLQRQIRELKEKIEELDTKDLSLSGESELDKRIKELQQQRSNIELELQRIGIPKRIMEELQSFRKNIKDLEDQISTLDKEYIRRLTVVKDTFSNLANSLMRDLEFNYTAEIDEKYRIVIKKDNVKMDLKKLSTSEKTAIALVLVLIGLKEYFKSPFFIIDESFMTFDQRRFEKIQKYLSGIVDYTIITKSNDTVQFRNEKLLEPNQIMG